MGKWIARLKAEHTPTPAGATDETDRTPLRQVVEVSSVSPERGSADLSPTEHGLDLSAVAWTDADIARFRARRDRLLRWGWTETDAEALADKLVRRDHEADSRVVCAECRHYRPGRCSNHREAGLDAPDVGRDLAALLQRCPGFRTVR
jgi:hypothetical protein